MPAAPAEITRFQTKLTYGMICYKSKSVFNLWEGKFQTKLTYGMICYDAAARALQGSSFGFKLS